MAIFCLVWMTDYNDQIFFTSKRYGLVNSVFIYFVVYMWFCRVYRAFAIASNPLGETIFSQFISFGISDLILYLICVLLRRHFVDITFMCIGMAVQLVITAWIVVVTKHIIMKKIVPFKTLLIYGDLVKEEDVVRFSNKLLRKYEHLFNIADTKNVKDIQENDIDEYEEVILYGMDVSDRNKISLECMNHHKVFYFVPDIEDIMFRSCDEKYYMDTPILRYNYEYEKKDLLAAKRFFDILFSFIGLIITAIPMLIIGILIKLEDKGPAFFIQERVTKGGKKFPIYKFRSMVVDADKYGVVPTTDNDPRITKIGKFIRATRIDELPQLINIFLGDMSFVGPRPERVEHVEMYEKEYPAFAYRKRVKGGLTGYAQVYGKYNTSAEDKLKLDLFYIENQSLLLDLKILVMTVLVVFRKESTEGFEKKEEG